jgi:O-antigen/teichoic acid export membrane protein
LAQIAFGLFYATAVGSNLTGKTHYQTISVAAALGVFAALCYILIPQYGMLGAALSSASGYAVLTGLSCLLSLRVYPIRYEWGRIAVLLIVAAALSTFGFMVTAHNLVLDIALKISLVALYPLLLYAVGFLNPSERKLLQHFPSILFKGEVASQRAGSP